jgi:hypothetical protein
LRLEVKLSPEQHEPKEGASFFQTLTVMSSYPSARTTSILIGLATVGLVSIWAIGRLGSQAYEAQKAEERKNRKAKDASRS